MSRLTVNLCFLAVFAAPTSVYAQNPLSSDPQALTYATQSMAALTNGTSISDVTLTGNFTLSSGSDNQSGSVTLYAKGIGESRVDLSLSGGTQSDVRNATSGSPAGSWTKNGGSPTAYAQHNCWTDAAWFFPTLSSLTQSSNPNFVFKYIGQEQHGGVTTQHIQVYQSSAQNPDLQRLSTSDFYLDAGSLLPSAVAFNVHSDTNMNTNIPIEADFTNYQLIAGIQIPFHVQQLINGNLFLDITLTSAALNTGLSDNLFTLQ
jgi:hypothetical protein